MDRPSKKRCLTIRISEQEHEALKNIRKLYGKPASQLIRESIYFYETFYNSTSTKTETAFE